MTPFPPLFSLWRRQTSYLLIFFAGDPLNILGAIPTVALDYAPLWNFNLFAWSNYSIANGIRTRMTGEFEVLGMAAAGYVTAPDGSPLVTQNLVTSEYFLSH